MQQARLVQAERLCDLVGIFEALLDVSRKQRGLIGWCFAFTFPIEQDQAERERIAGDRTQFRTLGEQDALQRPPLGWCHDRIRWRDLAIGEGPDFELGMALLREAGATVMTGRNDTACIGMSAQIGDDDAGDDIEKLRGLVGIQNAGNLVEAVEHEKQLACLLHALEMFVEKCAGSIRHAVPDVSQNKFGELIMGRRLVE